MAYYVRLRSTPPDLDHLAELVVRHKDGKDYYAIAGRLAEQLGLAPKDRLKLRQKVARLSEGTYFAVRTGE